MCVCEANVVLRSLVCFVVLRDDSHVLHVILCVLLCVRNMIYGVFICSSCVFFTSTSLIFMQFSTHV